MSSAATVRAVVEVSLPIGSLQLVVLYTDHVLGEHYVRIVR